VRAVDYLLKPFSDGRFFESLDRAVETVRLRRGTSPTDPSRPLVRSFAPPGDRRLVIEDAGTTLVLPLAEVLWMEASGPYVVIHAGEDHVVRRSLSSLSADLAESGFVRVHRSALVNLGAVRTLRPLSHGDAVTLLSDGTSVRVSRSRREAFESALYGDEPGP
jgi:two-component system LytT family response regulator